MTEIEAQALGAERRAARLLRAYPRAWRARYGAEFTALLVDDMLERPHSPRRTLDVLRCATVERLADLGVTGDRLTGLARSRSNSSAVAISAIPFTLLALAVWSQLAVGWHWASPRSGAAATGMWLMTVALLGLACVTMPVTVALLFAIARTATQRGQRARLIAPTLLAGAGLAGLVIGSRHFGHNWPGTGGHHWAWQYLAPPSIAGPVWAATLSINSYWAHPGTLTAFSAGRLLWMGLSPLAWIALIAGLVMLARRTARPGPPTTSTTRFRAVLALGAAGAMGLFTVGACAWVFANPAPPGLFHPGAIDAAALVTLAAAMVIALACAARAASAIRTTST